MNPRIYLDWNATTPLRPEARAAMAAAMDVAGNPSSVHAEGRAARDLVETARAQVAALVGVAPRQVQFTSGGTEANNQALGLLASGVIVSAIEHPSVLEPGRARGAAVLPVTPSGVADLAALPALLAAAGPRPLVSLMLANNETGVMQPVAAAATTVHAAGGILHADAVQVTGKYSIRFNELAVDLLSISAHKLGGPKGVGALILSEALAGTVPGLLRGGGQERGTRGGTENVIGITGFGAAAEAADKHLKNEVALMRGLRDRLEAGLREVTPDIVVFGEAAERLPNTVMFGHPSLRAETAVIGFDLDGFAVSSGSACSSGKVHLSHVLEAMAVSPALAQGAIRLSLGRDSTESDIETVLKAWRKRAAALL